jgi:Bacteriophage tail sheath protein
MPATLTYPGVYIEEIPSGVRTITGVATSITAFIGGAKRGPVNIATTINSFGDYERIFGGLWLNSSVGYAVRDFYLNGGSQAIIVRLFGAPFAKEEDRAKAGAAAKEVADKAKAAADTATAKADAKKKADDINKDAARKDFEKQAATAVFNAIKALPDTATAADVKAAADAAVVSASLASKAMLSVGDIPLEAAYEGGWGANLRATVNLDNIPSTSPDLFNLVVRDAETGASERYLNLSVDANSPRRADNVLAAGSDLVRWSGDWPATAPDLENLRKAIKELDDAKKATPPVPDTIAQKQDALWLLNQDSVTQAESKYQRAKAAWEQSQNSGASAADIQKAKDAADAARTALDKAESDMTNAVSDGLTLTVNDFLPANGQTDKKGLYALEQADLFNILCLPPYKDADQELDVDVNLVSTAASYCEERRAMLLVDAPKNWKDKTTAKNKFSDPDTDNVGTRSKNSALFFPRVKQPNPLRDNQTEEFVPCGVVAGVFARTDTQRGVWKAPAGLDATLVGVPQLKVNLTDDENGELNPLGINCLRSFPVTGRVVWGARTLRGADQLADEWKYIPVRRTALFIEESLYRGTQWVVFEPNDEPLWAQIRLNVGAFMHTLFRQGAFQGQTPKDAYFVKCDKESTTQNDINLGIVNIIVGFAPLKPAEFVIIKLQQMAGQIET